MRSTKVKYRVWSAKAHRWITEEDHVLLRSDGATVRVAYASEEDLELEGLATIEITGLTLCFWTGLHDKNGVGIYEGDILRYVVPPEHDDGSTCNERYLVEWLNFGFGAQWLNPPTGRRSGGSTLTLQGADEDLEVIGNIHETPELLQAVS